MPGLKKYYIFAFIIQAIFLIMYRAELLGIGREVYYSDAEVYWHETKNMIETGSAGGWNIGYIYYSFLIQKLSFFESVALINVSNMMLIHLSISILGFIMLKNDISKKNISFFIIINSLNPLIFYALFRNVKDSLFLFYSVLSIAIIYYYSHEKNMIKKSILFISMVMIIYLLYDIRPWGFLVPISGYIVADINKERSKVNKVINISIITLGLIIILSMPRINATLNMWVPIVFNNGLSQSLKGLILGPFNLLIGPGPIRSIFGSKYFVYYTNIGNIAGFIGSIIWWLALPMLLAQVKISKHSNLLSRLIGIIVFIFISIYTMQYGGSAEIRFRGVLYVLFSGYILSNWELNINKKICLKYSCIGIIIVIGGVIFGL